MTPGLRVAVDIGGTFTDAVVFDPVTNSVFEAKSSTTPDDFSRGVFDALDVADIDLAALEHLACDLRVPRLVRSHQRDRQPEKVERNDENRRDHPKRSRLGPMQLYALITFHLFRNFGDSRSRCCIYCHLYS